MSSVLQYQRLPDFASIFMQAMDSAQREKQIKAQQAAADQERQDKQDERENLRKAIDLNQRGSPGYLQQMYPEVAMKLEEQTRQREKAAREQDAFDAEQSAKRTEATAQRKRVVARALAANPELAPTLQQQIDRWAEAGQIDRFQIPGHTQAPSLAGPQMAPSKDELAALDAEASMVLGAVKPADMTTEQRNYAATVSDPAFADFLRKGKQQPASVADLRKEFQGSPAFKAAQEVQTAWRKIRGAGADAAGDMSVIYGFMKLQDPGSTVREGEYATAENAQGIPGRIVALYNKIVDGQKLTPEQRSQFRREAGRLYGAQRKTIDDMAGEYRRLAEKEGYDPGDVVLNLWGGSQAQTSEKDSEPETPKATPRPKRRVAPAPQIPVAFAQRLEEDYKAGRISEEKYRAKKAELEGAK